LDTLARDEDALAQAIWVQYEVPPMDPSKPNGSRAKGLTLNRGTHDVAPSPDPRRRGTIWLAGSASSSILALNTLNPDPKTRTREWVIDETRATINVAPNTLVERNGHLFFTELKGDHIGEIDIGTGEMHRYLAPTPAQNMHGIAADSRGNIWYVGLIGTVGRFDVKTKTFTEWTPVKGGNFYQLRIDQRDRVWVASSARRMLVMWDPKTEKWSTYKTPDNIRRIDVDSKGKVWTNEYFANAVVMFDPDTQKMTEYRLPLKNGNPYETCVDPNDNIWLENAEYQSFVKFDQRTKKFTYFPYPDLNAHTPDMESDAKGTDLGAVGRGDHAVRRRIGLDAPGLLKGVGVDLDDLIALAERDPEGGRIRSGRRRCLAAGLRAEVCRERQPDDTDTREEQRDPFHQRPPAGIMMAVRQPPDTSRHVIQPYAVGRSANSFRNSC